MLKHLRHVTVKDKIDRVKNTVALMLRGIFLSWNVLLVGVK